MTTASTKRTRLVSLLGMLMLLLSITPMGVAAQTGITPGEQVAQTTAGPAIELLIGECPVDAPADPSDLIPGCLQNGMVDVNVQVTSTDPALGIDQPKVTEQPQEPGPGVINTGAIPLGEYKLTLDLPVEDNRFFFECRQRGTDTAVPVTASPDGAANSFLVTTSGTVDIVCSAFVTPTQAPPTIEITYRECTRADLTGDGRTFEDLDSNCTTVATDPPTFNVRDLNVPNQPVTQHQLDAEGKFLVTLTPGAFDFFTDLDMDEWGEYLFCEYEGQDRYEKDFHPERGITTFTDLLPGEEIKCDWFAVNATEEAAPAAAATQAPQPTATATETTQQPAARLQAEAVEPTLNIIYRECTRGDMPSDARTYQDLDTNCDTVAANPPTITLTAEGQAATQHTLDASGVVQIDLGQGVNTLATGLDVNQWGQYLFCEYENQPLYQKNFEPATGGFTFVDIIDEQIRCDWFAVNVSETASGEVPPPPVVAPTNGSIDITMRSCQSEESVGDTSSLDAFRANCTPGIENMVFSLVSETDARLSAVTLPTGEATFPDVPAGDWQLWSEIPLEAATEYYFCADESGVYSALQLSDRGVASFNDFNGQNITCEIYVIPENLRGDVTGASVEVHLAACPIGYDGSTWYDDCHANGVGDQPFTLTGPSGELTSEAVVERTPGPGIARFSALPAGDYVLAGGPPQDFGTVFLYCSDPATSTQVVTTFADGRGSFTLAENQSIVCDWYFVPDDQGAPTPTPTTTPVAEKAAIFTTMFICPPGVNVAGSTFSQLDSACAERLSNVPMTLQSPGGVPITANTGASGEGAIRFFDLVSGDYVLTPTLPTEYVSAAVYCDLDGINVYQKALANGATTFTNVDGDQISCSWFVTAKPQPATGPTGSITIREMLCEGDRATIVDWERECQPGTSGVSFTITSSGGAITQTLAPNDQGVAVFTGLPNEYFDVKQSEGAWCRAKAERVDAQSRVIVANGGNTDVFLYQCNQQIGLPNTGSGPAASDSSSQLTSSFTLGAISLPFFAIAAWQIRRWKLATIASSREAVQVAIARTPEGYRYR